MARPAKGYFLDGERVPGTTTITGRFKDSGGLMYWACAQGQKYYNLPTMQALKGEMEQAANAGTIAHDLFHRFVRGVGGIGVFQIMDQYECDKKTAEQAWRASENGKRWFEQTKAEVLWSEEPLVSKEYRFGGTPDHVIRVSGKNRLMDVKTGGVYMDALLQVAAYCQLVQEVKEQDIYGCDIVRFSKDHADFVHRSYEDLSDAWEMFKLFRKAYDLGKILEKRVK